MRLTHCLVGAYLLLASCASQAYADDPLARANAKLAEAWRMAEVSLNERIEFCETQKVRNAPRALDNNELSRLGFSIEQMSGALFLVSMENEDACDGEAWDNAALAHARYYHFVKTHGDKLAENNVSVLDENGDPSPEAYEESFGFYFGVDEYLVQKSLAKIDEAPPTEAQLDYVRNVVGPDPFSPSGWFDAQIPANFQLPETTE